MVGSTTFTVHGRYYSHFTGKKKRHRGVSKLLKFTQLVNGKAGFLPRHVILEPKFDVLR